MGKRNIFTMGMTIVFVLLISLAGAGGVGAAPPSDGPPGQGDCDHGNSQQSCKPDPQPSNGQDCDNHGNNGGVNEDHCSGAPEVTPSFTPSSEPSGEPSSEPSPTATPSTTPSGEPSSTPSTPATESPSVPSVRPPTTEATPPPTDAEPTSSAVGSGNLFYVLAGIVATVIAATLLQPRRQRRR